MKSIEFMYWLQGCFEVCEVEQFTTHQMILIKNHLKMADLTEGNEVLPFCTWIKGFLDSVETEVPSIKQTQVLKNKLNNLFEHVVQDPLEIVYTSYPSPSSHMQINPDESSELIRC